MATSSETTTTRILPCLFMALMSITTAAAQGSALSTVAEMILSFTDHYRDPEGCVFTCPRGTTPVPNPHHQPTTNGCGAFGFQLDKNFPLKDLTKCCDEHDYCYDMCNNSKKYCDHRFHECLQNICEGMPKVLKKNQDVYKGCMRTAELVYSAAAALGCKPYKDAQAKACICKPMRGYHHHSEL